MRIHVRRIGLGTDGATRSWVERRLKGAVGLHSFSVVRVAVRVEDPGGAGGGGTAACSIEACLQPAGRVLVFHTGRDAQEAAERAVESIASAVAESLGRREEMRPPGAQARMLPETRP